MRTPFLRILVGTLAVVLLAGAVAKAQVESGQIAGVVTDQSGAIITGADVTVKNLGTNAVRTVRSSANGTYTVTGLPPARYEVTITSSSFKPFTANVEVTVGGHASVDAKLSVSASTT